MNRKYFIKSLILIFLCLSVCNLLYAQPENSQEYFTRADEKFANNDLEGALADLEVSLRLDPNNSDSIYLAGLCVNLIAFQYFSEKKYDKALPFLKKLHELSPDDKEIAGMYYISKSKVKKEPPDAEKKPPVQKQETGLKQTYFLTPGSMVLVAGALILTVVLSGLYYNRQRDAMFKKYEEKILSKMSKEGKGMPVAVKPPEGRAARTLKKTDTETRIHTVEAIEAELANKGEERKIGIRLLQPFVEDDDKEVRLRAARALYKYDEGDALNKFTLLGHSADTKICIKAVRALAKIPSEKTIRILFGIGINDDKEVVREVIKALYKIYEKEEIELSGDTKKMIEDFISASEKEWVVE